MGDYDLMESSIDVEASTDARLFIEKLAGEETADQIGGEIALKADNVGNGDFNPKADFRRKWLLPGIAGFKTKMEFLACADLTGSTDAKVTFGLRQKAKNVVELERTLVGEEIGLDDRVKVDLGTTLSYPDKIDRGRRGQQHSAEAGTGEPRGGSRQDRYLHRPRLSARRAELLPPPSCGLRGVHIHNFARRFGKYVLRISGVLRSESLSEKRSIFYWPPIFHSESHAR